MANAAKVLVVDDDEVVGRSFDRVLTAKGYRVKTAMSGEEALQEVGKDGFDLVFADIKMPGMDGLEMAQRIKEMNPWLPIVIVTGYGTEANESRAQEVGVADFLRKPLAPDVLERIAEKTLEEKEAEKGLVKETTVTAEPAVAVEQPVNYAKNIGLFFAAPFIGLAYIIAFPFVGFAMFLRFALKSKAAGPGPQGNQS